MNDTNYSSDKTIALDTSSESLNTTSNCASTQAQERKRLRLGLYGGSFDPIHLGHLKTACYVLERLELDCLYLLPNASPPHKDSLKLPYHHRVAMIEEALSDFKDKRLQLSFLEQDSSAKHYTINTLERFGSEHPNAEIFFVMGMDSLLTLDTWKDYPHLIELANLVVLPRPHYELSTLKEHLRTLIAPYLINLQDTPAPAGADSVSSGSAGSACAGSAGLAGHHYYILAAPKFDISSTEIRALLCKEESDLSAQQRHFLSSALSRGTLEYIYRHHLYRAK